MVYLALRPLVVRKTYVSPWFSLSFGLMDLFNIPFGFIDGAMSAIQSKVKHVLCIKNSKEMRKYMEAFSSNINEWTQTNTKEAMF